jgi:hypothetical protein
MTEANEKAKGLKDNEVGQSELMDGLDPLFPTRKEIEQMARSNPVLCRAINMGAMQKLNWVETMHLAVKCLVEYSDDQKKTMIKMAEISTVSLLIKDRG